MKKNVYVIDDDLLVLDMVTAKLTQAGYDATSYSDPAAFLAVAPSLEFGCVVLDLAMPGMDGLQVQEELSKLALGFHIIFYSARGSVRHAVEGMRGGAADFLQKSPDLHPLMNAIDRGFRKFALAKAVG